MNISKRWDVQKEEVGINLHTYFRGKIPLLPSSLIYKYIRTKKIKVNGQRTTHNYKLQEEDVVQAYIGDDFFQEVTKENAFLYVKDHKLSIVYENKDLLLVDKKPGTLCNQSDDELFSSLQTQAQAYLYSKGEIKLESDFLPCLCNRLDRNTGGIVIIAKNPESKNIIDEKIRCHEIDKYYLCIVHGKPTLKKGILEHQLFKDEKNNIVTVSKKRRVGTKTAITEYELLESSDGLSLIQCRLITGRTHQIRAQMAYIGHPLLGDGKYGRNSMNKNFGIWSQQLYSYKILFSFKNEAGILECLNNKSFTVQSIPFKASLFTKNIEAL
ncbi:MAG: RluA family pseudouridine synthase [Clostridiales bacterium]|nr:RluA family pseudouridine synthase [Clostridiales bacterium]